MSEYGPSPVEAKSEVREALETVGKGAIVLAGFAEVIRAVSL